MRHLSTKRCLGAQNAIHVEEMLPKRSECDTCRQNAASVLKMRHLSTKCCLVAQNAIHVKEIQPKLRMPHLSTKCYLDAQNAIHVEEMTLSCSECDTCRQNEV